MRRGVLLLFVFVLSWNNLAAQSFSAARVLADAQMREFKWAIGTGDTVEEADKDAISQLSEMAGVHVGKSDKQVAIDSTISGVSGENYTSTTNMVSNAYFENLRKEILADENGRKRVLRYMPIADWEARHDSYRAKIEEYINAGRYASQVEDQVRYYSWALILMHYYTGDTPIKVDDQMPARQWLISELQTIFRNINVSVVAIDPDKEDRNYPYKLSLDFTYNGEPIGYMKFGYFDGGGYIDGEAIKDGRGLIAMKQLPTEIQVDIDCFDRDLARQMDPMVFELLSNVTPLEGSSKTVRTDITGKPKAPKKPVEVESAVQTKLTENVKSYVEVKQGVGDTTPYTNIMTAIVGSIKGLSTGDISHHFTPSAWNHYQKIVASGSPTLARDPEYKFIKHDTLVFCRALPLKLKFKGERSFIEDVVFRVNEKTHKIESVAYKLSATTEKTILGMDWEDAARLTLLTFLEDYRTAYCLKDLGYINKVFADDAYIVVGRVLKPSTKKFNDSVSGVLGERTVYVQKSKRQYIANLQKSFASKEFVNIRFEECNTAKGYGAKEGIYAVQVRQLYFSNNYADEGILTLAIDMRQDTNPLVRVRVWQQERDVAYDAEKMIDETVSTSGSVNAK